MYSIIAGFAVGLVLGLIVLVRLGDEGLTERRITCGCLALLGAMVGMCWAVWLGDSSPASGWALSRRGTAHARHEPAACK
jgi:hypothetical protein